MFSPPEVSLLWCQTWQKMTQESLLVLWRQDSPSCHVQGAAPAADKCHWNKRQKETCTQRILERTTRIRSRTCAPFLRTSCCQWRIESFSNSHLGEGCPYASVTLHLLPVRGRAFQTSLSTRHEPRLLFCQEQEGAGRAAWPRSRSRTVSARRTRCSRQGWVHRTRRGRDREDWGLLSPLEIRTADLYLCVLRWFVCFKKHHILGTDTYS